MNYAAMKPVDIANGPGVRVSLFVSGCTHHCKGCFNKEAWDFEYGMPFTEDAQKKVLDCLSHDYIEGLSLLGGEPMEPVNQEGLLPFIKKVRERFPEKTIWCYTGYDFDKDIMGRMMKNSQISRELLSLIDVIVDGEFIDEQRNLSLKFRGSQNQRIIDVKRSVEAGKSVWAEEFKPVS